MWLVQGKGSVCLDNHSHMHINPHLLLKTRRVNVKAGYRGQGRAYCRGLISFAEFRARNWGAFRVLCRRLKGSFYTEGACMVKACLEGKITMRHSPNLSRVLQYRKLKIQSFQFWMAKKPKETLSSSRIVFEGNFSFDHSNSTGMSEGCSHLPAVWRLSLVWC